VDVKGVQTLDRALDIIELLSLEQNGIGVTEISHKLDLHKSTVHRLLNALAVRGYVEKEERHSKYSLGLKFVEIGCHRLNHLELKVEAAPSLRSLADSTRQPVHLAILDGNEVVYIEKIEPVANLRMYSQIGKRVPVYCSALGKSLLSETKEDDLKKILSGTEFKSFTSKTFSSIDQLIVDVDDVRRKGWSLDDEEHEAGIRCIASPVRDYTGKIIAAVSVSGDRQIISPERDSEVSVSVMNTAGIISKRMGFFVS
jgi:IclR family transcriptional regulator, KDG regulon repressor